MMGGVGPGARVPMTVLVVLVWRRYQSINRYALSVFCFVVNSSFHGIYGPMFVFSYTSHYNDLLSRHKIRVMDACVKLPEQRKR